MCPVDVDRLMAVRLLPTQGFQFAESEYANIYAWRLCTVCGGIYLFFVTERCLTLLLEYLEVCLKMSTAHMICEMKRGLRKSRIILNDHWRTSVAIR